MPGGATCRALSLTALPPSASFLSHLHYTRCTAAVSTVSAPAMSRSPLTTGNPSEKRPAGGPSIDHDATPPASVHTHRRHRWRHVLVALLAVILVAGALAWPFKSTIHMWRVHRAMRGWIVTVEEAVGARRLSEMRIVMESPYSPPPQDAATRSQSLPVEARIAVAHLEQQPEAARDADAQAAIAAAALVEGRAPEAVTRLERARGSGLETGRLFLTLSAAYHQRAADGDLTRALDASRAGLRRFPSPALRFNLAVLAAKLLSAAEASTLWNDYVSADAEPQDGWRHEGRERLARLRLSMRTPGERLASPAPPAPVSVLRHVLTETWLPEWAAACVDGRLDAAAAARDRIRAAAARLTHEAKDRYVADLAASLFDRQTLGGCDRDAARAYQAFEQARQLYRHDRRTDARARFELLAREHALDTPLGLDIRLYITTTRYLGGVRDGVLTDLAAVTSRATSAGWPTLLARAFWMRGYALQELEHYQDALVSYQQAMQAYREAHDDDGVAAAHSLLAGLFDALGDFSRGWREREQALMRVSAVVEPRVQFITLGEAARASARDGLLAAGLTFGDAALTAARAMGSEVRMAEANIERAELAMRSGLVREAAEMLSAVRARLESADAPQGSERTRAALLAALSKIEPPGARAELLDRAIDTYRRAGADMPIARLLLARGRARAAAGDAASAEQDFAEGIQLFERARGQLSDLDLRLSYFEEAWALFDEMIALQMDRDRPMRALEFAVQARARELDRRPRAASSSLPVPDLDLDEDVRVVMFVVLETRTVAWVFAPQGLQVRVLPVSRAEVQRLTHAFRLSLTDHGAADAIKPASAALYDALFAPLSDLLPARARLKVVPDPLMQSIPLPALWDARRQKYLIEAHEITWWPGLWASGPDDDRTRAAASGGGRPRHALVIGDPTADAARPDGLSGLAGARSEAEAIAALYPRSTLLAGSAATQEAFLRLAPAAEIVHFAGHAQVDAELPALSRLLFAGDRARTEASPLYAFQIGRQRFARTRLVVLAACDTAVGRTYRSEGALSLARTFLVAGAPAVVATLWPVDDVAVAPLFRRLHERVRNGERPAAALRAAQLEALHGADASQRSPATWAALVNNELRE
jgi:CHAT domain-containing protein